MAIDQTFFAPSEVTVFEVPPEQMASKPSLYHLRPAHFIQPPSSPPNRRLKKGSVPEPYLILGFDTEFKTPDIDIQREDIRAGKAKYEVLSYQFHAITENGNTCSGICCPKDGERVSLGEFLTFALGRCISSEKINALPRSIYLVGHFTRADMPAFSDFEDYTRIISAVRNTFISIDNHIKVRIPLDKEDIDLRVFLRDTMLLTPGSSRSLSALGAILERPKIKLHDDPKIEQEMKRNMDLVRRDHWDLFRDYALNDAIICAEYLHGLPPEKWSSLMYGL